MNSNAKIPVSVVVIAKNEASRIRECLESVRWADEIIVVDDYSTDNTPGIAREYTDKIFQRAMDIEGRHRNAAYGLASRDWILSLDADERVSSDLADEIQTIIRENQPEISGCAIPIKTFIGKRWIETAGYYPARKLRMHRRGKFRYEETGVHPRAFLEGRERPMTGDILHYGFRDFAHCIEKLNNQTTLEAEKWLADRRRIKSMKIFYKSLDRFCRNYFGKGGFQGGFLGFIMSFFHALYQLLTYAKYLESKQPRRNEPQDRLH